MKTAAVGRFFPFDRLPVNNPVNIELESLHLVMSLPGMVRGNHIHPETGEWICVFGGPARFFWEDEGQVRSRDLDDETTLIHIPAGVGHALRNNGDKPNFLIAFRKKNPAVRIV